MTKRKQPARLNRYANLVSSPKKRVQKRRKKTGRFAWFRNLSLKKKLLLLGAPILAALILIPLITYLMLANDIRDRDRLMNRNNTGVVLEDSEGKAFYSIGRAEHRNEVSLDQISDYTEKALIAGEDKDFYNHAGFSPLSIIRALVTRTGGGSTLTQQLVKNTLLSDQRTFLRKYQELFMAIAIEQNYTKDEILTMYLNSVYFGENAFGIEDAARVYFNKTPQELSLAESAMLIGVLPAPSTYSPISGVKEYAKQRQETVLTRMVKNGYITEEEKQQALATELAYSSGGANDNTIAPHFAEMVMKQLSDTYGYETIMRSGYQVRTTLNMNDQNALVGSVNDGMRHINAMGGTNASGIIIDPTNGDVRALVGSADYNNEQWGKVNMVTSARQPGSTFKPIYYSFALADGAITPATVLDDKVIDFGGGYRPRDADRNEASRGTASVRQSLSWSLNIPSIHVMQQYTIDKSVKAANTLGIDQVKPGQDYGLSLAMGSVEVPLQTMTHAYAAFANEGRQYDMVMVREIEDKFNKKIFTAENKSKQTISREGAYLISNILSDNTTLSRLFGQSLTVNGHTVAVKTGTTDEARDAWTIGYNPQYVVGVWVGNNDNTAMRSGGSDMAGPIWRNTFIKILSGQQNREFPMPPNIVKRDVCRNNGGLADRTGPNTYNEIFMAGALPTNSCNAEPTMIDVCEIATGKVISIDETKFDEATQSKDTENCKPPTRQVCELDSGKVITIDADDFDDEEHSTDIANCKKPSGEDGTAPNQVQACDTTTGSVVTIQRSQLDGTRYTTNTANCTKV